MVNKVIRFDYQQTMTSLQIAEVTGKRHSDILEAIRNMEPAWEKVAQRRFPLGSYTDSQNKTQPMFYLTRDGFTLLVMGDIRELSCSEVFRLCNFADTSYVDEPDVAKRDMGVIRKILAMAENSAVLSEGRNLPSFELVKVVNGDKV